MSEAKYTKGPWVFDEGANSHIFDILIKTEEHAFPIGFCDIENAQLIAAAPELLEACKEVLRAYGIYDHAVASAAQPLAIEFMKVGDRLKAAINKATGES